MTHHPASLGRDITRMELAAEIPQVLSGVIEIHDLDGSRKLFLGQVPDPFRAISHDHFLLRPVPTSPLSLGVEAAGKLLRPFRSLPYSWWPSFVSHGPAFGIHRGLAVKTQPSRTSRVCARPLLPLPFRPCSSLLTMGTPVPSICTHHHRDHLSHGDGQLPVAGLAGWCPARGGRYPHRCFPWSVFDRLGSDFQSGQQLHLLAAALERGALTAHQRQHAAHSGRELGVLHIQCRVGGEDSPRRQRDNQQ